MSEIFAQQQLVEEKGIQATHWLSGVAAPLPLQKRRALVHHIQSEIVACAFHHDPKVCASHVRDGLTYDLWSYIQKTPTQSQQTIQMIENFSVWAAEQAPTPSSILKEMFWKLLPEDKAPQKSKPGNLDVYRSDISMPPR